MQNNKDNEAKQVEKEKKRQQLNEITTQSEEKQSKFQRGQKIATSQSKAYKQ